MLLLSWKRWERRGREKNVTFTVNLEYHPWQQQQHPLCAKSGMHSGVLWRFRVCYVDLKSICNNSGQRLHWMQAAFWRYWLFSFGRSPCCRRHTYARACWFGPIWTGIFLEDDDDGWKCPKRTENKEGAPSSHTMSNSKDALDSLVIFQAIVQKRNTLLNWKQGSHCPFSDCVISPAALFAGWEVSLTKDRKSSNPFVSWNWPLDPYSEWRWR